MRTSPNSAYDKGTCQIDADCSYAADFPQADTTPICDACAFSGPARGWTGVGPDESECRHPQAALPGSVVRRSVGNELCVAMRSRDGACGPEGRLFDAHHRKPLADPPPNISGDDLGWPDVVIVVAVAAMAFAFGALPWSPR